MDYKYQHNMVDYDDLLYYTVVALHRNEGARRSMDKHYQYIMCDEYQDTNIIQDDLLNLISRDYPNLAVVGDENQSIYRFRGAIVENILTFVKRHPGCKTTMLVQNYRSTQEILNVSNAVMGHAMEGVQKILRGQKNGEVPDFMVEENAMDLAASIVDRIQEYHRHGVPYRKMAIIVRNGFMSGPEESLLTREGIPFKKYGGMKFFQKEAVRDILAFIRAAASTEDTVAWMRALKIYPGIGTATAIEVSDAVATGEYGAPACMKYMRRKYYHSLEEMADVTRRLQSLSIQDQVQWLVEEYYAPLKKRSIEGGRMSASKRTEALRKLAQDMTELQPLADIAANYVSPQDFIADICLQGTDTDKDEDSLVITTIHSAKGLEWDVVFLLNPIQGIFPRSRDDSMDDREELRCLYVALTRARERLHICIPETSIYWGKEGNNELSHHLAYNDVLATCVCPPEIRHMLPGAASQARWGFR